MGRNELCADQGAGGAGHGEHSRGWKRECEQPEAGFALTHHTH